MIALVLIYPPPSRGHTDSVAKQVALCFLGRRRVLRRDTFVTAVVEMGPGRSHNVAAKPHPVWPDGAPARVTPFKPGGGREGWMLKKKSRGIKKIRFAGADPGFFKRGGGCPS